MNSPLRVLHLEDDVRDAELVQAALEAEGIPIDLTRVETEQDFVATLNRGSSDLILADYTLPSFDGLSALRIAQQQLPNVPFLFVSGTLGEDAAIEALKTGATDYILKTRLSRLGPAVTRALREARETTERRHAEEALREGERRYRNIFEGAGVSIWEEDFSQVKAALDELKASGVRDFRQYMAAHPEFVRKAIPMVRVLEVNEATLKLLGAGTKDELLGSLEKIFLPETVEVFAGELLAIAEGRNSFEAETVLQTLQGEKLWVLFTITFPPERPELDRVLVSITDISERKRAEALQTGEKRLLEMIATRVPLHDILNALCIIIEEQRRGTLASVLLLNPDGVHLDFVAGPSVPKRWARQMETVPIGPCAGSCGTAAYRAAPVIVSDIATDPLWDLPEHRAAAFKHGLRASWSNPVLSSKGQVLGTFCMYYREPRSPNAQDLELIELATHLIGVAIERDRAEAAVRASEQVARGQVDALMQSLDVLATAPAPETFIREMLVTIGRQLRALRVALWLRTKSDDSLSLRLAVQGEQPVPEDPEHPFVKDPHAWKTMVIGQEMLFTGGPVVCEEMEQDTRLSEELRAYLTNKGARKFLTVPVLVTGEVRGFIGIQHAARDPYRSEEIELAQALAHQVMLAIQLTQLAERGRQAAVLEERTRMARDIHDTLAQGFTGVVVQMEAAEDALSDEASDEALEHISRARQLARDSLNEARRSVRALRPQALERAGFCAALKQTIVKPTIGTPLRSEFQVEGDVRELPPGLEENLLHIGQEALTNALKHAQASRFEARLCFQPDGVRLELSDNGQGFIDEGANGGFGLIGMRERVEQIGGTLTVSSAQGEGTKIVAVAPYQPGETG